MTNDGEKVENVNSFEYLGSLLTTDGNVNSFEYLDSLLTTDGNVNSF